MMKTALAMIPIEISRTELIPIIISHYQALLRESAMKIYTFQEKYGCGFNEFDARVKSSEKEDFTLWDDYLEWKAHAKSASEIVEKIKIIQNGLFEIV